MDPTPPIIPPAETPPTYGPVTEQVTAQPAPSQKKRIPLWMFVFATLFVILLVAIVILRGNNASDANTEPGPTPTATVSSTPTRVLSAIATQSAFSKFETDLDALARGIQNTQTQNQQLLPPRLELPLGF